jgi:hypothetical protein
MNQLLLTSVSPFAAKRSVYEAQSQILKQFLPTSTIAEVAPIAPQAGGASQQHLKQMYSSSPHKPVHLQQQIVPQPAKPVASAPSSSAIEQSNYTSLPAAPKGPPQGGWADPRLENFPGTGIVLAADSQGVLTVAGLVQVGILDSNIPQSRSSAEALFPGAALVDEGHPPLILCHKMSGERSDTNRESHAYFCIR